MTKWDSFMFECAAQDKEVIVNFDIMLGWWEISGLINDIYVIHRGPMFHLLFPSFLLKTMFSVFMHVLCFAAWHLKLCPKCSGFD